VPRPAAEIVDGEGKDVLQNRARLKTEGGNDVTKAFLQGAQRTLEIAQKHHVVMAILKARSPSCGSSFIYDGSFRGIRRPGAGVTAALLQREGIEVFHEEELEDAYLYFEKQLTSF